MADDPGHKAMLYFLEILMYSNTPMTISQLAGRFGSRNFTQEMRTSAGDVSYEFLSFFFYFFFIFLFNFFYRITCIRNYRLKDTCSC